MNRKVLAMLRVATVGVAAAAIPCLAPEQGSAGVYNDVTAWWQLDFGDSGVITNYNDIRDARDWYSPGGYKATSVQGTPEWTTSVPAAGPGGGLVYGGRGMDFTPAVDGGGNVTADGFVVSNLAVGGDATLMTRFKWDGYPSDQSSAWMYRNGFGTGQGWLFGLGDDTSGTHPRLYLAGGPGPISDLVVTAGTWYDMAVVIDENGATDNVTFYLWEDGGALASRSYSVSGWDFNQIGASTNVGFESPTGGNGKKSFDGVMENLAIWNRALSLAEVHEAFGSPDPLWSLGLDNNSNVDFNVENSAGNNYTIGEPWGKLSRAVTSYGNSQVAINFDATLEQAALPYIFHLDMDGSSGGIDFSVLVNGTKLGTFTAANNADYEVLVPAGTLVTGSNTLTLQYESGTGYTCWDWMALGGSWQVGSDNNSYMEFEYEGVAGVDHFYVTDPNLKHLARALTSGHPDIYLHFNLSDELAVWEDGYVFTTEITKPGGVPGDTDVEINGHLLTTIPAGTPDRTVFDLRIWPWMLQSGDNVIKFHYRGTSDYFGFDYHRFQVAVPEPASVILLGVGLLGLCGMTARRNRCKRDC